MRTDIVATWREKYTLYMARTQFTGISPRAWEHPADRAALAALKKVPGIDQVLKFFWGMTWEKQIRLRFLASSVRVTEKQFPKLHKIVDEACNTFDVADRPQLFVDQEPNLNAGAWGVKEPFITLNSSMLDTLSDDEILAVIGHELGHIMSGHVLYKNLLWFLVNSTGLLRAIPLPFLVIMGVLAALKEWDRKSELSADRAGLLTVQDTDVSYTLLMKLAGGKHVDQMDLAEFERQADDYDAAGDVLEGIYKFLNLVFQSHPFPVLRLRSLKGWVDAGDYQTILDGTYVKRDQDEESIAHDFSEAQKAYESEFKGSNDPLAKAMSDIGEGFENVRSEAEKFFSSLFKRDE